MSGPPIPHYLLGLPKFMSIESVIPPNHLILCCPLLLLPSVFSSIRVFSSKLAIPTPTDTSKPYPYPHPHAQHWVGRADESGWTGQGSGLCSLFLSLPIAWASQVVNRLVFQGSCSEKKLRGKQGGRGMACLKEGPVHRWPRVFWKGGLPTLHRGRCGPGAL